jgi:hypothetical protein
MSRHGWHRDSSFRRTRNGSRLKSSQVWAKVNAPPVPSKTHLHAATCRRRISNSFLLVGNIWAYPIRLCRRHSSRTW